MAFIGLFGLLMMLVGILSMIVPLRSLAISSRRRGLLVTLAGVALVGLAAYNTPPPSQAIPPQAAQQPAAAPPPGAPAAPAASATLATPAAAKRVATLMPIPQQKFVAAIEAGRLAHRRAASSPQGALSRRTRSTQICAALVSMRVGGWVGQVSYANGEGQLKVDFAESMSVRTSSDTIFSSSDGTLLDRSSPLFRKVSTLTPGQWVTFSGFFRQDPRDCVRESSATLAASMEQPQFIFRFVAIDRLSL